MADDSTKSVPDAKQLSRGASTDMSPQAIARRLEIWSQLYELTTALNKSRKLPSTNSPRRP